MRPTGPAHLGHLLGAFENWEAMQDDYDTFYCIVDWHALTTDYADTSQLKANTHELALDFLAVGLDPERSTLFVQSHVPQHAELHLLMSMVVPLPWLERVPTYKEQMNQLREKDLTTYGFLGYPLLQSADILIYRADTVPVGVDQALLPEPEVKLTPTPKLPGTDGRKMSKSYRNTIGLAEDEASIRKKLKTMVTDPARKLRTDPGDPAICPVFDLHEVFSTQDTRDWAAEGCRIASIGCIEGKSALADALVPRLEPIRARREAFAKRPDDVRDIFREGGRKAREVAESTMVDVRAAVKLPTEDDI